MARILIDIGHPAHVHLFRGAARRWMARGHPVTFTALDREMIVYLLDYYRLPYTVTYKRRRGKLARLLELVFRTLATYRLARRFAPDLFVSMGSPTVGLPARLLRKPYLALTDTDHAVEQHALFKPLATLIVTPDVFAPDLGTKHVRCASYHELAYLHPDEFTPDPAALTPLGLQPGDRFFIVRFVAWGATHDVGQHGFTLEEKRALLRELAAAGRVLLSVEGEVDAEFRPFITPFAPEIIHHLLAFATLYIGEGGTMASEAAVLGTPALFVSTLRAGTWQNLRDRYHLLECFDTGREALARARELLAKPDLKTEWAQKRARLLADKLNLTPWLVELGERLIENPRYRPPHG